MNNKIQKCNNNEVTVCWKDVCVTAAGFLGTLLVVGVAAYGIAEAAKAINKIAK